MPCPRFGVMPRPWLPAPSRGSWATRAGSGVGVARKDAAGDTHERSTAQATRLTDALASISDTSLAQLVASDTLPSCLNRCRRPCSRCASLCLVPRPVITLGCCSHAKNYFLTPSVFTAGCHGARRRRMGSRRWLLPVLLLLASVASERQGVSRDDASSAAHPGNLQDGEDSGEAADERTWVPRHRVSPPHHWNSANVLSQWHQRKVAEVEQQQALGRLDTALKLCETLLRTEPTHAPTLTLKAKVLDAKGLFSAARRSAQLAIDADPRFTPAYKLLGELYVAQGQRHLRQPELRDYEAAYEAFRRIVLLDLERNILPSTVMARAYDGMARALDAAGAEAAALSNLETAITISPGDATLQHRFGHLLLERAARLGGDGALVPVADENRTASALRRALHLQYHPLLWLHVVAVKQVHETRAPETRKHAADQHACTRSASLSP